MTRIPNGTQVRLSDGSEATAHFDPRDGTYRTAQPSGHGGTRIDEGWRREQLEVILTCNCGEVGPVQCDEHGPRE